MRKRLVLLGITEESQDNSIKIGDSVVFYYEVLSSVKIGEIKEIDIFNGFIGYLIKLNLNNLALIVRDKVVNELYKCIKRREEGHFVIRNNEFFCKIINIGRLNQLLKIIIEE